MTLSPRVTLSDIDVPEKYRQVMEQIDSDGWHSIDWSKGFTLLHWAAKTNRADLCRRFLAQNADPSLRDHSGRTPLDHAEAKDASEALEVLREALESSRFPGTHQGEAGFRFATHGRYDFEQESVAATDEAAKIDKDSVPEAYLKIMENIDNNGWETIQWARGFTLLHWAAKNNRADLCARFLRQGADPNSADDKGRTPADYATQRNNIEVLEVLQKEMTFGQEADARTLFSSSKVGRQTQIVRTL
jgi:ankyrin repeat protein